MQRSPTAAVPATAVPAAVAAARKTKYGSLARSLCEVRVRVCGCGFAGAGGCACVYTRVESKTLTCTVEGAVVVQW